MMKEVGWFVDLTVEYFRDVQTKKLRKLLKELPIKNSNIRILKNIDLLIPPYITPNFSFYKLSRLVYKKVTF